ncbi:helix-turn-helix domain-containing protein [Aquincola sp. MAHUQ-54]|uniref:Helix-turn-helix domain-containing protein n=1 Tax=Aquincola agrisoli TaxID=3119538 RepID=A0AAW9QA57_9BURK
MKTPSEASLKLAAFLRAGRERLKPDEVGLPAGGRRRAAGLRREEVAQLAGISTTWYTWIEQGRTVAVSARALGALAGALKLSRAERAYLFELAALADPGRPAADGDGGALQQPALQPLVQAVRTPAYVLDRHWDALAWNRPAARLFGGWLGARPMTERNLLRYVFLAPQARTFIADWAERAQRLVAEYRADTAGERDDPAGRALVGGLCSESPAFDAAWRSQRVLAREGGARRFHHPRDGLLAYEQFTLRLAQHAALKLIVLVPA